MDTSQNNNNPPQTEGNIQLDPAKDSRAPKKNGSQRETLEHPVASTTPTTGRSQPPLVELLGPQADSTVKPPDSISLEDIQTTSADLDDFQEKEIGEPAIPVVHKPDADKKFWACPDPAYQGTFFTLEVESETGLGKTRYLVTKRGLPYVPADRVSLAFLVLCKYHGEGGEFFLLKASALTYNNDPDRWTKSAHACIKEAMHGPIRMYSKREKPGGKLKQGYYRSVVLDEQRKNYTPPEWPKPEEKPFLEFLKIAFEGKIIDGPDHPVLAQFNDERPLVE
jgi:hypothetical protein